MGIRVLTTSPVGLRRGGAANAATPRRWPFLALLLVTIGQALPAAAAAPSATPARGRAFAQRTCSSCHATGLYGTSRNPNAPPFGAIANQEGLTRETLTYWLRGAHNYPIEMDFYLHERDVDALVAYFLSLRTPHYRRPAD